MKNLFVQAVKFFGISGIGWLLDFGIYTVLGFFFHNLFLNNIISSWVGVTFTFIFSNRSVFKSNSRIPVQAKYFLYLVYQVMLIFVISKALQFVDAQILRIFDAEIIVKSSFLIAKILVTPVTMFLNFVVMKILLEKM
ncbi:MAG: GtrA family protein [Treponema sp.]|uniref:GtrA family protein n=1 Tax=Treponema sp. TaxID=166 RepID=UPI0025DE459A|nr:GtrA family protein [Treponema sp.]MBR0497104.1 GtrA family protein [Treponema sp.]